MYWEQVYDPQDPDPAWIIPTARLCNDFVDAIVNQRNPLATIEDAALIVDCTSGIYASHFAGRPLALPLENRRHPLK
jgi:predicted dehydrogenase